MFSGKPAADGASGGLREGVPAGAGCKKPDYAMLFVIAVAMDADGR